VKRHQYYEELKARARVIRAEHGLDSPRVLRSDMRRIYKHYKIKIDLWPYKLKNLKGAFFGGSLSPSVMLRKDLPPDPMIFTMGHELKHFLEDRELQVSYCNDENKDEAIEIGAEIFAAELIFPERDFTEHMRQRGIAVNCCTAEDIVKLKHETRTTLSYEGLKKRATYLHFAREGALDNVKWILLEREMYGVPFYLTQKDNH
jgi:Zn-dependent peptidase ImmA (M78 family)